MSQTYSLTNLLIYYEASVDDRTLLDRVTALSAELGGELSKRLARLHELERDFALTVEAAKLDALKEFAYGASHEINNPLANISARAQTLLQDERDPERRRRLAAINSQAFRAHEMIADVMLFARPPRMDRREIDLSTLIAAIVDEMSEHAAAQGTQLAHRADSPQIASVDPVHFRVALTAIITNSLEALSEGGRIEVELHRAPAADRDSSSTRAPPQAAMAQIIVSDTGPGISPAIRPLSTTAWAGRISKTQPSQPGSAPTPSISAGDAGLLISTTTGGPIF